MSVPISARYEDRTIPGHHKQQFTQSRAITDNTRYYLTNALHIFIRRNFPESEQFLEVGFAGCMNQSILISCYTFARLNRWKLYTNRGKQSNKSKSQINMSMVSLSEKTVNLQLPQEMSIILERS